MRVLVLGYGEMGHAMETLLGPRHELSIWDKYPPPGFRSARLEDAAPKADYVVFCLPAGPHREVLERIAPALAPGSVCLTIAKGLDEAGHTAFGVFDTVLTDRRRFALLYGPMIAEEIRAGRPGFAQAGCESAALFDRVAALFRRSALHLWRAADLEGMTWSVVLKNVYAIALGMADELALGDNTRGFLLVRALAELERIVVDLGGEPGTTRNLAGLGDLVTTATSAGSHHRAVGGRLARGETVDIDGEGVHTLAMIEAHRLLDISRYPLMQTVDRAVRDPRQAAGALRRYVQSAAA